MCDHVWVVVGGADKGGILVRQGASATAAREAERLETGALVRGSELEGDRLRYTLLQGRGPAEGWVSLRLEGPPIKDLLVEAADVWQVVGGGDKGGIVVRESKDTASAQVPQRLETGALVLGLEEDGERLRVRRLTGSGPDTGWVSVRLQNGKELLARLHPEGCATAQQEPPPQPPRSSYGSFITEYMERLMSGEIVGPIDTYLQRLGAGASRGNALGRPSTTEAEPVDADFEAWRKVVEGRCHGDTAALAAAKIPSPWVRLSRKDLEARAPKMVDGECYGLPVPPTLRELEELGATWLTKAFHTAGTMPLDNSVSRVVQFKRLPTTTKDAAGGAGPKAFLTLEYSQPDPDMHTELFVKMPWAVEGTKELGGDVLWRMESSCRSDSEFQECAIYRFLGPLFPFKTPKYYFADICRWSTNYILITEKIQYGRRDGKSFAPYEVLPCPEKYFDFKLEPSMRSEMYYSIMRAQARLAAWDQLGIFNHIPPEFRGMQIQAPPLGSFHWPPALAEKARASRRRGARAMAETLCDFVGDVARQCFPSECSSKTFLTAVADCMEDAGAFSEEFRLYFSLFPQYVGLQHPNLNADNAYFWRNSEGRMDCGIIDWGGAAPQNCVSVMTGSITGAEGDVLDEHDVELLRCFRDEYRRECGLELDLVEMERQWHLTYVNYLIYVAMHIEQDVKRLMKVEEWRKIDSLADERVLSHWTVRCYTYMTALALRYLHRRWVRGGRSRLHIHETFREWKDYWTSHGLS